MALISLEDRVEKARYQHIDGNEYYPALERTRNRALVGRPVIIRYKSIVSAASYEARKLGFSAGMPFFQAEEMIAGGLNAAVLWSDLEFYQAASRVMMGIIREENPEMETYSIDEAFLRYEGSDWTDLENAGSRIMKRISKELGITASVGNAYSKYAAKMTSSHYKPDMQVTCHDETEFAAMFHHLPVAELHGAGQATEAKLHQRGVFTIGQLAATEPWQLRSGFGKTTAETLVQKALGIWKWKFGQKERSSYGRTIGIPPEYRQSVKAQLKGIEITAGWVSDEMQLEAAKGRVIIAGMRTRAAGDLDRTRQQTLRHYTDDGKTILSVGEALYEELYKAVGPNSVSRVGVRVAGAKYALPEQLAMVI